MSNNAQMRALLRQLYATDEADAVMKRLEARLKRCVPLAPRTEAWSEGDILLITYADAIRSPGEAPLVSLRRFLHAHFKNRISLVHLLPFFPYTSDDGFAVSSYLEVDAPHGEWSDVERLSEDVDLVFDLVINHASSAHPRFQDFLADRSPGNRYFLTADEDTDLSSVTRPRATPVLQSYETASGPRHVWCTFSRDQVDWDFSNPEVLYEFIKVFIRYIERGASWVRLDAIAYLWKEVGTTCIHLPQTHAAVKLLRLVAEHISRDIKILTETNVPLEENLSYFGEGDEAHIVYNFSMPPLVVQGLLSGSSRHLTQWCRSLPTLPSGCTYLNFTASHDGIGLRPAEGILNEEELTELTTCLSNFGGRLTHRQRPDGTLSPYEANIALFDAFRGTVNGVDHWQVERFLVSQAIMLSFAGVPALYYQSLLAAPNHEEGVAATGRARTINRRKWTRAEIDEHWANPLGAPARVLEGLKQMLDVRRSQPAFHPEAPQAALDIHPQLFALERRSDKKSQRLLCVFNLSHQPVSAELSEFKLEEAELSTPLFSQGEFKTDGGHLVCSPYAIGWFLQTDCSPASR